MRLFGLFSFAVRVFLAVLLAAVCCHGGAQLVSPGSKGTLAGTVADPTGAVIPQARITVTRDGGSPVLATSDGAGQFSVSGLPAGSYDIEAEAPGFQPAQKTAVRVAAGAVQRLTLTLAIATDQQQVVVSGSAEDASPESNGGAIVMKGDDLRALSDDPDELQTQLEAIAGSDPETGTQFYVDGFSGGRLPPKSAIKAIRINQNPYSAQYDTLGFGRIEIETKPGADKLHGDLWMQGNDSPWNAPNPFVTSQPPYYSYQYDGDLNGPIHKVASYFASVYNQRGVNDAIVNAVVLDPNFAPVPFTQAISSPASTLELAPRVDLQWGKVQTLSLRYQLQPDHGHQCRRGTVRTGLAGLQQHQHRAGAAVERLAGLRGKDPERDAFSIHSRPQPAVAAIARADRCRAGRIHGRRQQCRHQPR
jgi:hypothetical protein